MSVLLETVENEIVRMIARNLEGSPAASESAEVAGVYCDDFENRGLTDDDAERVKAAFDALGPQVTRFPPPAQVLQCLPAKTPPKMIEQKSNPEVARRNIAAMREAMRKAGLPTPDTDTPRKQR